MERILRRLAIAALVLTNLIFSGLASATVLATGSNAGEPYQVELVAEGFGIPWGLAFINEEELLVTSREGRLSLLNVKSGDNHDIDGLPEVSDRGQGGLLDVAVPPDYDPLLPDKSWIYFTYSSTPNKKAATVLARAQLSNDSQSLNNWQNLIKTESAGSGGRHFGSRIAFDNDGYIYFGVGDRGERDNGQDLTTHASTILRLNRDGSVPADNPFINRPSALPEIWSYGHRNPQGMAYDRLNNRLWSSEHGPRGGDEINLIEKGNNYGWPEVSLGKEYFSPSQVGEDSKAGMIDPVKNYTPSIAPGSLLLYQGNAFPNWRGSLFLGALKSKHLNRVSLDNTGKAVDEEILLEELEQRIRSLTEDSTGNIYLGVDSGDIWVIKPSR